MIDPFDLKLHGCLTIFMKYYEILRAFALYLFAYL